MGAWIVDGTGCTALCFAALHLHRNGRYWGEGGEGVEPEKEAQIVQGIRASRTSVNQSRAEQNVWQP